MPFTAVPDRSAGYAVQLADWNYLKDNFNSGVWTKYASSLVSSPTTITFSSIPSTHSHLMIVAYVRGDTAATNTEFVLRYNGDTGSNYDSDRVYSNGGTRTHSMFLALSSQGVGIMPAGTATAGLFATIAVILPNYASTTAQKTMVHRFASKINTSANGMWVGVGGGGWRSTAAINQIEMRGNVGPNLAVGSHLSLYLMA